MLVRRAQQPVWGHGGAAPPAPSDAVSGRGAQLLPDRSQREALSGGPPFCSKDDVAPQWAQLSESDRSLAHHADVEVAEDGAFANSPESSAPELAHLRELPSATEHVQAAWASRRSFVLPLPLDSDLQEAIDTLRKDSAATVRRLRCEGIAELRALEREVPAPVRPAPLESWPAVERFRRLLEKYEYDDVEAATVCAQACPLVGDLSGPGTWPDVPNPRAAATVADILAHDREGRAAFLSSVRPSNHDAALMKASLEDVRKGRMAGPFASAAEVEAWLGGECAMSRRFGVQQADKLRECDDFTKRSAHVNAGARCLKKMRLASVDTVLSVALALGTEGGEMPSDGIHLWKGDHASAYRQVPILEAHQRLAVVVFCHPETGHHVFFVHHALPFGAVASVVGYNRISRAIAFLARKMFALPVVSYFDDFIGVELGRGSGLGFAAFQELNRVLGFVLKWRKDWWPAPRAPVLGVDVSVAALPFKVSVTSERCQRLTAMLQGFVAAGSVSPTEGGTAAGKLRFAQAGVFGAVGRAAIQPFFRRQHAPAPCRGIGHGMSRAIQFWLELLRRPPARKVHHPSKVRPRRVLYTDASGEGIICGVLFTDGPRHPKVFSLRIPSSVRHALLARRNQIALFEAIAAVVALFLFAPWISDTEVLVFEDNQATEGFLRNGFARGVAQDASRLAALWWDKCMRLRLSPWIEWVPSDLNVSDGPTRPAEPLKSAELLTLQPEWLRQATFPPQVRDVLHSLYD